MTADIGTRVAQVREQISALTDQGLDSVDIAARLGITVSRVDQVLDQLEGAHLAALPPVTPPMRHPAGPPAPKLASIPVPKQEAAPQQKPPAATHGTRSAYQLHYAHGEKPCQACKDAWNESQRQKTAAKRPADWKPFEKVIRPAAKRPRGEVQCGTVNGYRKHVRDNTTVCDPCRDARNEYQRAGRATRLQAAKPKVLVHWLIPRGLDHTDMRAEYAIEKPGGGVQIVGHATAELHAADGTKILTRWTTNWIDAR